MNRRGRRWLMLLVAVATALAMAVPLAALEIADSGIIAADRVIDDDLIIAGNMVYINGTVTGDVIASGNQVVVNGEIGGSLAVMAQTVIINGSVAGSVYGAAVAAELGAGASIGRNVIYAGFSLITQPNAAVAQDVRMAVYQFVHAGSIGRDAKAALGAAEIVGTVGRDLIVELGEEPAGEGAPFVLIPGAPPTIPPGLRVASEAQIGGRLRYTSPSDEGISILAEPAGGIQHVRTARPDEPTTTREGWLAALGAMGLAVLRWLYARARELVTLLLLGALALWLLRSRYLGIVDVAERKPVESAGWGLLVTVGGYIAFAVAAVVIVVAGVALSIISLGGLTGSFVAIAVSCLVASLILFLFTVRWASKLVLIYLVGRAILRGISPKEQGIGWPLVIGALIYVVLRSIPIVGGLLALIVTLVGMGALWLYLRQVVGCRHAGDDAESAALSTAAD